MSEGPRYRRHPGIEEQTFEDELLLQHTAHRTVLGLNLPAAALWEALRWPQSADDLAAILIEAWPDRSLAWARDEVAAALESLIERQFVDRVGS